MNEKRMWDKQVSKWYFTDVDENTDKDGYCKCYICQAQKRKELKTPLVPDELFEL